MGELSKRRGAISVFLLIIFVVTYVFMGLLVDAGRYRMAKVYAESALDSATNSLLSSYDQLLFDLYGLFAFDAEGKTDEQLKAEIEARYRKYLGEALGIAKVDASKYSTQLANTIFNENGKIVLDASSLYDFSVTDLSVGSGITLADTKNVENQIIEYMKYRAPLQLVDDMQGFLSKIEEILTIKDSLKIASEKNDIVKKYENPKEGDPLSKRANEFIKEMNVFSVRFYNFTVDPTKELPAIGTEVEKSAENNPYRLMNLAETFDAQVQAAINEYESERSKKYDKKVSKALTDLQKEMKKDESAEISVNHTYEGEEGQTTNFTEIDIDAIMSNPAEIHDLAEELSKKVDDDGGYYSAFLKAYDEAEEAYSGTDQDLVSKYNTKINAARATLQTSVENIETNAEYMYEETSVLFQRMCALAQEYDDYVNELTAKVEANKNSPMYQDYLTQYGPTIELAKANGGEITSNLELLGNSRKYLLQMSDGYFDAPKEKLSDWIGPMADKVIERVSSPQTASGRSLLVSDINSAIGAVDNYTNGTASEDLHLNVYEEAVGTLFPNMQGDICVLFSKASYFQRVYYRKDVDVKVGEEIKENDVSQSGKDSMKKIEGLSAVDKQIVRDNPEWINVSYEETKYEKGDDKLKEETGLDVELATGKVDTGFMSVALNAGNVLLEGLGNLLEGARDNLYVDAYVMSTFPNYKDWKEWSKTKTSDLKALNAPYEKEGVSYNASYGSVEYVITGAPGTKEAGFGESSIEAIRVKLFGTRMLFNTMSIMLDAGKISQAQSLSAWAGVLSPLVTVVLLAAWAAMESVIDVMILMGDLEVGEQLEKEGLSTDGVLVFKKGDNWYFSVNGMASLIAGKAIDSLANSATKEAQEIADGFEQKANAMIFEAYTSAKGNVDAIFEDINLSRAEELNKWVDELNGNLKTINEVAGNSQINTLTSKIDEAVDIFSKDGLKAKVNDGLLSAKENAALGVSRLSKEAVKKVDEGVKALGKSAKDTVKNNLHKVIPVGEVVNTGTKADGVRMTYEDYLYFYLFTMDQDVKIQRIQSLIQMNMRVGGNESFSMSDSVVSAWADLECSIKYLFMSNPIVPESMKKNGRLRFKVISSQSY